MTGVISPGQSIFTAISLGKPQVSRKPFLKLRNIRRFLHLWATQIEICVQWGGGIMEGVDLKPFLRQKVTLLHWSHQGENPDRHTRFQAIFLKKIIFTILFIDWQIQHFLIKNKSIRLAYPMKLNPSWEEGRKWRVYWLENGRATEEWTSGSFGFFYFKRK